MEISLGATKRYFHPLMARQLAAMAGCPKNARRSFRHSDDAIVVAWGFVSTEANGYFYLPSVAVMLSWGAILNKLWTFSFSDCDGSHRHEGMTRGNA